MSGPDAATRGRVRARDEGTCQWCGRYSAVDDSELQHRRARGMGGSKRPDTNLTSNLVLLHRACHGHIESHREESRIRGFTIRQNQDPRAVPVEDRYGHWWLLDDVGAKVRLFGPEVNEYRQLAGIVPGVAS